MSQRMLDGSHESAFPKCQPEAVLNFFPKGCPCRFNLVRWVLHKPLRAAGFEQSEQGFLCGGVPV